MEENTQGNSGSIPSTPPAPPSAPPAENTGAAQSNDPTIGSPAFHEAQSSGLPPESVEQGARASTYVDNPDAPEGSIAQIEVLPDETPPSADGDDA